MNLRNIFVILIFLIIGFSFFLFTSADVYSLSYDDDIIEYNLSDNSTNQETISPLYIIFVSILLTVLIGVLHIYNHKSGSKISYKKDE